MPEPVIFIFPVPVMSQLFKSKSPPSCGVVSSTTSTKKRPSKSVVTVEASFIVPVKTPSLVLKPNEDKNLSVPAAP